MPWCIWKYVVEMWLMVPDVVWSHPKWMINQTNGDWNNQNNPTMGDFRSNKFYIPWSVHHFLGKLLQGAIWAMGTFLYKCTVGEIIPVQRTRYCDHSAIESMESITSNIDHTQRFWSLPQKTVIYEVVPTSLTWFIAIIIRCMLVITVIFGVATQ